MQVRGRGERRDEGWRRWCEREKEELYKRYNVRKKGVSKKFSCQIREFLLYASEGERREERGEMRDGITVAKKRGKG